MTSALAPLPPGRKAIFLDIDGTYADHGQVPHAHAHAVRAARAAGHLTFLCTGRPRSLIFDHVLAAGFDGVVAAAGGHVTLGHEVLEDVRFPRELAARTIAALDAQRAAYWVEAPEATYARESTIDAIVAHRERRRQRDAEASDPEAAHSRQDISAHLTAVEDLSSVTFAKITSLAANAPLAQIAASIGPAVASIPSSIPELGPGAGELFLAHLHKARGIQTVISKLGLTPDDVVAFGDGLNDLEMLEFAGTGIAIEGSHPDLLAVADATCAGPSESGLADAFIALGLIEA
ncbi:HAD-IIB family hydrolase [Demequina sp. NBRC 110052]|uniref:HAD-IIB family hydrolase n=1 Tax=Demequina sp. NBRC 110052 TaxID=1570341 RepID=UPI0009FDDBED|nr:HAD-IIB family hydrolase [Demequina sp. NBRC 110052]